jgi:hypothetical protein
MKKEIKDLSSLNRKTDQDKIEDFVMKIEQQQQMRVMQEEQLKNLKAIINKNTKDLVIYEK